MQKAGPDSKIPGIAVHALEDIRKHIVAAHDMLQATESKLVRFSISKKGFKN